MLPCCTSLRGFAGACPRSVRSRDAAPPRLRCQRLHLSMQRPLVSPEARCCVGAPRTPFAGVPLGRPRPIFRPRGVGSSCPTSSGACGRALPMQECGRVPPISRQRPSVCCAVSLPPCRKPHMSLCGVCQPAVALELHAPAGRPLRTCVRVAWRGACAGGGGGQESSPRSTVLLPAWCGCLWAGCCPQGLTSPPLALRAGPVTHSFRFTGTPR